MTQKNTKRLRSREWFDIPGDPSATALHIERYTNFGISAAELRSGKPVIGIAQTGSDLVPCTRSHLDHVKRVREGIRQSGGIAIEFPVHPVQESGKRPTAALDRNLQYLSLVEVLFGYPKLLYQFLLFLLVDNLHHLHHHSKSNHPIHLPHLP